MKIFIDTEFYEFHPIHYGRNGEDLPYPCIGGNAVQLISIAAVREDGAKFYAENRFFDWSHVPADHWLQENVRPHTFSVVFDGAQRGFPNSFPSETLAGGVLSPQQIADEFRYFATQPVLMHDFIEGKSNHDPEFWGYFCDYDWVVLCGLYGRMIDLPEEFPKYCLDLKQEMHRLGVKRDDLPAQTEGNHHALADARWIRDAYVYTRVAGGEELS